MSETIAEILENGIIVAADEETGLLVQANGSYFNLYQKVGDPGADNSWNKWVCVNCTTNSEWGDMNTRTAADFVDRGRDLARGFTVTDSGLTVVGKNVRVDP